MKRDEISEAMLRAKDFAIVPSVPTRKQFSVALQALLDSHDGESVSIEHAERIALYLDAIYAKLGEAPDAAE